MRVDVRVNVREVLRELERVKRDQIPYATALALTRTALEVKAQEVREMKRVFDRPTSFTLNSVYVRGANKKTLTAYVGLKYLDRLDESYLDPQIIGGPRRLKRFEVLLQARGILRKGYYAVPASGARLDRFGNVSRGQIQQILSALGAQFDRYANRSDSAASRRNARNAQYFVPPPWSHLALGIYQRFGFARGSAIKPVFIFVQQPPTYRARLDFDGIGDRTAQKEFPQQFEVAMSEAMATAK